MPDEAHEQESGRTSMDGDRSAEKSTAERQTAPSVRRTRAPRVALKIWQTRQWAQMRHALAQRQRIVCFDAEWEYQPPNRVTELGIATWHDGGVTVQNIRVRGSGRPFRNGQTIRMADDAAKAWLRNIMASADLLVGHALQNDRLKMKQWGCPLPSTQILPVVDTGAWSRIINTESGNPRRLVHLADEYGIERKGLHVAGMDALVTLKVALAMAATAPVE